MKHRMTKSEAKALSSQEVWDLVSDQHPKATHFDNVLMLFTVMSLAIGVLHLLGTWVINGELSGEALRLFLLSFISLVIFTVTVGWVARSTYIEVTE